MFGFGKVRCWICTTEVSRKDAFLHKDRYDVVVCKACYERWEHEGRKCADCRSVVMSAQDIGAFLGRQALGHCDCGALSLGLAG